MAAMTSLVNLVFYGGGWHESTPLPSGFVANTVSRRHVTAIGKRQPNGNQNAL